MNHQERLELLAALSRAGVSHYKSHDLEIRLGGQAQPESSSPGPLGGPTTPPAQSIPQNDVATEKLKDLIGTLKLDDASLIDKIFPAGAGG